MNKDELRVVILGIILAFALGFLIGFIFGHLINPQIIEITNIPPETLPGVVMP